MMIQDKKLKGKQKINLLFNRIKNIIFKNDIISIID